MPGNWEGSHRRADLPDDWAERKTYVWQRDQGLCQWPMNLDTHLVHDPAQFALDHLERCGQPARDVDHIQHGNNHDLDNLQLLCGWHHDRKSSAEGNTAKTKAAQARKAKAKHPGLL